MLDAARSRTRWRWRCWTRISRRSVSHRCGRHQRARSGARRGAASTARIRSAAAELGFRDRYFAPTRHGHHLDVIGRATGALPARQSARRRPAARRRDLRHHLLPQHPDLLRRRRAGPRHRRADATPGGGRPSVRRPVRGQSAARPRLRLDRTVPWPSPFARRPPSRPAATLRSPGQAAIDTPRSLPRQADRRAAIGSRPANAPTATPRSRRREPSIDEIHRMADQGGWPRPRGIARNTCANTVDRRRRCIFSA